MFTTTMYQDGYEYAPLQIHTAETYAEAYQWAYDWAKGFTRLFGGGFYRCEHDERTLLDRFDVYQPSYSRFDPDQRRYHVEIACNDLAAWHALVVERGSVWAA